jgi:hypothetical protein
MPRRFQGLGEYVTALSHFNLNSALNEADANYNQSLDHVRRPGTCEARANALIRGANR